MPPNDDNDLLSSPTLTEAVRLRSQVMKSLLVVPVGGGISGTLLLLLSGQGWVQVLGAALIVVPTIVYAAGWWYFALKNPDFLASDKHLTRIREINLFTNLSQTDRRLFIDVEEEPRKDAPKLEEKPTLKIGPGSGEG